MVRTKTTLVIGAGASVPYRLPLGSGLLSRAKKLRDEYRQYLDLMLVYAEQHLGLQTADFLAALADIEQFKGPSIDDFLEKRGNLPHAQQFGRAAIALLMADSLRRRGPEGSTPESGEDWIEVLGQQLVSGTSTPEQFLDVNRLQIVTFNFDSIVQNRLLRFLAHVYHRPISEEEMLKALPITHVHGRLPVPPASDLRPTRFEPDREWLAWLPAAAESVKVVSDQISDEIVLKAQRAISEAERVCFLGFSFHPKNVDRLGLRPARERLQYATAFGERGAAVERFRDALTGTYMRPTIGGKEEGCAAFLLDHPVLI